MAEFLEKISQQAAKLTTLEKDDIQLETEREARITAEQEKKFQDDMERFKKTKKVLPEYENTEVPQNLSMKELRMLAERARQDAAKWHKAYVRVEQDKEQNEIQLAQAQRRLRILETDFAENEEASSKLRVAQDRLAAVSAEAEDKKREVESLTSNVMVLQGAQKKQQAYIEDLNKRLDTLSGVRANSGRSLEDDLSHSYQLLSETEGQLVNLQTDLAYKTRDGDILRSQLETERTHAQTLQEGLTKREQDVAKLKVQLMHFQSEDGLRSKAELQSLEDEIEHLRRTIEEMQEHRMQESAEQEAKLVRHEALLKQDFEKDLQVKLNDQRKAIAHKSGVFTPCLPTAVVERGWAQQSNYVIMVITLILVWYVMRPPSINYKQCRQYLKMHTNRLYKSREAAAAAGDLATATIAEGNKADER
jgi:hypothetical protein